MIGFLLIIAGFIVIIIQLVIQINDSLKYDYYWFQEIFQCAADNNKAVCQMGYENNEPVYYQVGTTNKVYKGIGKDGLYRWYYINSNMPLQYSIDTNLEKNFKINIQQAKIKNRIWFVIDNFWEDSIERLENDRILNNTYLDDFMINSNPVEENEWMQFVNKWNSNHKIPKRKYSGCKHTHFIYANASEKDKKIIEDYCKDNNPLNQKIYIKNLKPYQLHMIIKEEDCSTKKYKQKQYLIRFATNNLKLDRRHCITEKQSNHYWTKWYAITNDEYKKLTNNNYGILYEAFHLDNSLQIKTHLKEIDNSTIAFEEENSINWDKKFAGIKKAFDCNGNFIDELEEK